MRGARERGGGWAMSLLFFPPSPLPQIPRVLFSRRFYYLRAWHKLYRKIPLYTLRALTWDFTVPVCQNWSRIRTMCTCCLCHLRENVFYLIANFFAFFFQQSICPGVALSKVLLAAQIPDKHEFTEFNSIARVSFTSLVANVVKILV